jgi:hypothetical protein
MRFLVTALTAVLAATAAVAEPAGGGGIPTRSCAERIEAGGKPLPFPAASEKRVVAGRLAFAGHFPRTPAALGPRLENGHFGTKVGAMLRAGAPVVLSVPPAFRGRLFLIYARSGTGHDAVRLEPCAPATRAFSYDGIVGPVTGFSGGFEVTRPGCYPLDVRNAARKTIRLRLALGRPCR